MKSIGKEGRTHLCPELGVSAAYQSPGMCSMPGAVCTWPKAPCVDTTGHQASLCTDVPVDLCRQNELAVSLRPLPLMHRVGGGGGPVCGALADFAQERRGPSWQVPGYDP